MRKILFTMCLVVSLMMCSMNTSAQTTVYFGNLDNKVSVGVGMPVGFTNQNVTFSIMQISKSKNFDEFSFRCVNANGDDLNFNLKVDTVYHLDIDNSYAHQIDYTLNRMDYSKMCMELNSTTTIVYINNVEYVGAAFVGILRALESEQNMMFSGRPNNFRNMTMWNWPTQNVEFMRFNNPANRRDTRYIRRPAFPNMTQPNMMRQIPQPNFNR